ncbi:MAG: TIGR03087 family PEP-CTERM/XrtA system glycosyltransferase [Gemmataceae bacterium]
MTSRPAILYLVHRVPYPPDKGDRIRSFHLLRFLQQHANVHLAAFTDEETTEETREVLNNYCSRVTIVRLGKWTRWLHALRFLLSGRTVSEGAHSSARMVRLLRDWAKETRYDAILASASSLVEYLGMPEFAERRRVVDLVDVDSEKWFDYSRGHPWPKSWLYRTEAERLRKVEKRLARDMAALTLVSDPEVDLFRDFCSQGGVHTATNGVDLDYFQASSSVSDPKLCVFVGALDYFPNVDGVCWFAVEVWPRIRERDPEAKFQIVGRNPVPEVRRLGAIPGIEVVGQVPDVRPYLDAAALALAPLQIARGLQNKVLEALAMKKAVVASPKAIAAIRVQPGEHLLTASEEDEWAQAVVSLLSDPVRRCQLGDTGRRFVEDNHDWDTCLRPFGELLGLAPEVQHTQAIS